MRISHLVLLPSCVLGFATRNEGDRIRMGDTIILESIKMPQTFLHSNGDSATPGVTREVNVSATPTRFQVVPVAKFRDVTSSGVSVRGGDFLQVRPWCSHLSDAVRLVLMMSRGCCSFHSCTSAKVRATYTVMGMAIQLCIVPRPKRRAKR
jgi:hypothetical protein